MRSLPLLGDPHHVGHAPGGLVSFEAVPIEHVYEGKAVGREGGIVVRERVDVKRLVVHVFGRAVSMERVPGSARWRVEVTVPADAPAGPHTAGLLATDWAGNAHRAELEIEVLASGALGALTGGGR